MTFPRFNTARHLLALSLVLGMAAAHAVDEPPNSNSFTTPGYPAAPAPMSGTTAAAAGPAGQGDAAASRSIRNLNAPDANPRPGAQSGSHLDTFPRRAEPPPQPSEFQKFVETATGRLLRVFGSRFFTDAANAYSPVDNIPVSADYTVGPGDEIVLRAWARSTSTTAARSIATAC